MINKIFLFEDINFDDLTYFSLKKDRQIFFHNTKPLVYKIFSNNWEFANQLETAIKRGYYNKKLIPNFIGLVKNKKGLNKGYVCRRVETNQILENCIINKFSIAYFKKLLKGDFNIIDFFTRRKYRPDKNHLIKFLKILFFRSFESKMLFVEITPPNIWVSDRGYHIFDLDAVRAFDWVFCKDKNDPEFIRKIGYKQCFNDNLKKIIELHNLQFPFNINRPEDINRFWKKFIKINKL